jgi:hypothetical protein
MAGPGIDPRIGHPLASTGGRSAQADRQDANQIKSVLTMIPEAYCETTKPRGDPSRENTPTSRPTPRSGRRRFETRPAPGRRRQRHVRALDVRPGFASREYCRPFHERTKRRSQRAPVPGEHLALEPVDAMTDDLLRGVLTRIGGLGRRTRQNGQGPARLQTDE